METPIFLTDFDPYVSPITKTPAKTSMSTPKPRWIQSLTQDKTAD
jgi:hypothetical protein